jgi:hypothetical protein
MLKQLFYTSIIVFFTMIAAFILGIFLLHHAGTQNSIVDFLQVHSKFVILYRFGIYILLVLFWRQIIIGLGKVINWNEEMIKALIEIRWKIFLFLACFDVLIIWGGLGKLIDLF